MPLPILQRRVTAPRGAAEHTAIRLLNRLTLLVANRVLVAAGAAVATTTSKVKTVTTSTTYTVDGVFCAKAATDNLWTLSGTTVPVASFQKYLLLLDAAGAASVLEGTAALTAAGVVLPDLPQSKCVIAVLTVATDATHTFVPGTTLLGATGITATVADGFDVAQLFGIVNTTSTATTPLQS